MSRQRTPVQAHPPGDDHFGLGPAEFVAIVATCMAMAALSIDLLLPAFPEMREAFGLDEDSTEVSRLITAFFFGLAVGQLFYGPLSDRFGRKRLLYAGLAIYCLSAAAAVFANSLGAVVACRFLWGFGAAAPRSLALAMIRDRFEGERMARTMSHVMTTFILIPVFAPGLGSLAMTVFPWRVVFWLPIGAAALLSLWLLRMPETLPPARRRPVSPAALWDAAGIVVRTRQTVAFGLAATCLFGMMTAYIGSCEIIIDEVFDQGDRFPLIFGVLAAMLGLGSMLSGRLVVRLGLARLIRYGAMYVVSAAALNAVVAVLTDGEPPLLLFCLCVAVMLPGVTALVPNCNTAAMVPLGHVAGMGAALLGTISTGGGSLLGSIVDASFDGTVKPFAFGALGFALGAALLIIFGAGALQTTSTPAPAAEVEPAPAQV